ncbi:MAG: ATP-binding cassette domain-containing protein, partial [Candidatus Izemoplasmatales bacterium]
MIYVANITKYYDNVRALTDINLEFHSQGFYAVMGPSKSGKTTLLNIIGSLEAPTTGKMMINLENHDFRSSKKVDAYRRHFVSYIFEDNNLIETLSVFDNLYICINTVEADKNRINMRIEKELIELSLLDVKYKKVADLSLDEKQRVAVARAALSHAKVIIADEPTNYLNSTNEKIILNKLKRMSKNTLVIVATKKELLAHLYADHIIKLKDSFVVGEVKKHKMNESIKLIPPINHHINYRYSNYIKIALNELIDKKEKYMMIVVGLIFGMFGIFLGLVSTSFAAIDTNQLPDTNLVEKAFQTTNNVSNLALGTSIILILTVMVLIYSIFIDVSTENKDKIKVLRSLGYSKHAIYRIYNIQHFILGIVSAMILTFLIIVFLMLNYLFLRVSEANLLFDWSHILLAYVLILNIPLLFSLLPVFKIS